MLMEALFSRGGYPIHHQINGFQYTFDRNDDGDFVCPVLSGEHREMMVRGGNFRIYTPPAKEEKAPEPEVTATEAPGADVAFAPESEPEKPSRRVERRKKAE